MSTKTDNTKRAAIAATIEGDTLTLNFANGKNLTLRGAVLLPEMQRHAMMHGLKQKLVDAAAISRNPDTGRAASIEDKYQAVLAVFERITAAEPSWNAVREGSGGGSGGLLLRALVQMYEGKRTPAQLREYLEGKTAQEKTALRKNPKIAAIIDTMRDDEGDVDSDELLSELD